MPDNEETQKENPIDKYERSPKEEQGDKNWDKQGPDNA